MFVLYSLSMCLCRGMASKALLMSTVVESALCAGHFELMPSKTCVRLVSKVFVECNGRNPCCVGARGISGWIIFSIRRSVILDGVQRFWMVHLSQYHYLDTGVVDAGVLNRYVVFHYN